MNAHVSITMSVQRSPPPRRSFVLLLFAPFPFSSSLHRIRLSFVRLIYFLLSSYALVFPIVLSTSWLASSQSSRSRLFSLKRSPLPPRPPRKPLLRILILFSVSSRIPQNLPRLLVSSGRRGQASRHPLLLFVSGEPLP